MPLADVIRLGLPLVTAQQIADLALSEDRQRREAIANGDAHRACAHDDEVARLVGLPGWSVTTYRT